jgi:TRAP-type C4-dicarboxylate transport system permease large subunit
MTVLIFLGSLLGTMALGIPIAYALLASGVALMWHLDLFDGATAREAVWALMPPVFILVGLRAGVFTPTEAAVVAAVYALFVSKVVYRELSLRDLYAIFVTAARTTAVVMFLVAAAMVSAWLITVANLPAQMVDLLRPLLDQPTLLLIAIMLLVMLVGTAIMSGTGCRPFDIRCASRACLRHPASNALRPIPRPSPLHSRPAARQARPIPTEGDNQCT